MGFGTGLNALLTFIFHQRSGVKIEYESIEKFPLSLTEVKHLNFLEQLQRGDLLEIFLRMHEKEGKLQLSPGFSLEKKVMDLERYESEQQFDIIFYDAFAPEVQPDLWTEKVFEKMYHLLCGEGILVTYCVKGEVRRRLKKVGFQIEKLKGPEGGKREVLRAKK